MNYQSYEEQQILNNALAINNDVAHDVPLIPPANPKFIQQLPNHLVDMRKPKTNEVYKRGGYSTQINEKTANINNSQTIIETLPGHETSNQKILRKRNEINTTKSYDNKGALIAAAKSGKLGNISIIQPNDLLEEQRRKNISPKTQARRQSILPVLEMNDREEDGMVAVDRLNSQLDPVQIFDRRTDMDTSTNGKSSYFNAKFNELQK